MENSMNISLGDIIQLTTNDQNDVIYYVDYCDNNLIIVKNENETIELVLENGFIKNKDVKKFKILIAIK